MIAATAAEACPVPRQSRQGGPSGAAAPWGFCPPSWSHPWPPSSPEAPITKSPNDNADGTGDQACMRSARRIEHRDVDHTAPALRRRRWWKRAKREGWVKLMSKALYQGAYRPPPTTHHHVDVEVIVPSRPRTNTHHPPHHSPPTHYPLPPPPPPPPPCTTRLMSKSLYRRVQARTPTDPPPRYRSNSNCRTHLPRTVPPAPPPVRPSLPSACHNTVTRHWVGKPRGKTKETSNKNTSISKIANNIMETTARSAQANCREFCRARCASQEIRGCAVAAPTQKNLKGQKWKKEKKEETKYCRQTSYEPGPRTQGHRSAGMRNTASRRP